MVHFSSTSTVGPRRDWSGSRSLASFRVAEAAEAPGAVFLLQKAQPRLPPGAWFWWPRGERGEGDGGGGGVDADVSRRTAKAVK